MTKIAFTKLIADIERVEPLNLKPFSSSVRYFSNTLLAQKQIGVKIPNSTGIQTGRGSLPLSAIANFLFFTDSYKILG